MLYCYPAHAVEGEAILERGSPRMDPTIEPDLMLMVLNVCNWICLALYLILQIPGNNPLVKLNLSSV